MTTVSKSPVRSRPLILAASEVRGVLDGAMTEIRRPINLSRIKHGASWVGWGEVDDGDPPGWCVRDVDSGQFEPAECWGETRITCPWGKPGDRLYVREVWWQNGYWACDVWHGWTPTEVDNPDCGRRFDDPGDHRHWRQRSPVGMPLWAARLHMEITSVGVERQSEDAMAPWLWVVAFRRIEAGRKEHGTDG